MKQEKKREFRCPDYTSWIVEQRGVLLIHTKGNRQTWLACPEDAVWDLLTRNRPRERLLHMLAVIADMDYEQAEKFLENCLEQWVKKGWLTSENTV
jgi:hypothetical protein